MRLKNHMKKFGFSLMEVALAVLIVAILALITVPIISKQLEKADEYSYYLAFKTVEKMAGQIVALGDPDEDSTAYLNVPDTTKIAHSKKQDSFGRYLSKKFAVRKKMEIFFATLGHRFAYSEAYMFKKLFPKSLAKTETVNQEVWSWNSDEVDQLWLAYKVCRGGKVQKGTETVTKTRTKADGTTEQYKEEQPTYYAKSDFDNCYGYTESGSGSSANEYVKELFDSENCPAPSSSSLSAHVTAITSGDKPNAKAYCEGKYSSTCQGSFMKGDTTYNYSIVYQTDEDDGTADDDGDDDIGDDAIQGVTVEAPTSDSFGNCILSTQYTYSYEDEDPEQFTSSKMTYPASWCTTHGYINMLNYSTETIDCRCNPSNYIESYNNERACFQPCANENEVLYATSSKTRLCCSTDFDPKHNQCCPENSTYNGEECECISGYKKEGSQCVLDYCPKGSHKTDDGYCVINPPLVYANRLCELIAKNWNISNKSCTGFTKSNDVDYNQAVYNAAKGNDGAFLSINSKTDPTTNFNSVTPNIVFSNGQKLWILADKAASIPGLSYFKPGTAGDISATQNVCRRLDLADHSRSACTSAGGYYCESERNCFTLDAASKNDMRDARNCCGATDMSDIQAAAEEKGKDWKSDPAAYAISGFTVFVDINGEKGDGTLWDDVYPFYIGANGTVYPGYPLNAPKGDNKDGKTVSSSLYLGGNSDKQLPADVYYYESNSDTRKKYTAFSGVSYARALCSARKLSKHTPYCLNLGDKFYGQGLGGATLEGNAYISIDDSSTSKNPCDKYNCFVTVRKKLSTF